MVMLVSANVDVIVRFHSKNIDDSYRDTPGKILKEP